MVHEAFLKLAEHFSKYKSLTSSEMTGLCVSIVKNKAIDLLRREKHYSDEELENLRLEERDETHYPEKVMENKVQQERIRILLEKLPEGLKNVLILKYYHQYTNREIAGILHITTKNVEVRLYRAKNRAKELMQNEEKKQI